MTASTAPKPADAASAEAAKAAVPASVGPSVPPHVPAPEKGTNAAAGRNGGGRDDGPAAPRPDPRWPTLTMPQRYARSVARRPGLHLGAAVAFALALSAAVVPFGLRNLDLRVTNVGYFTRGTLIGDRGTQLELTQRGGGDGRFPEEGYCDGTSWYKAMVDPDELYLNSVWRVDDGMGTAMASALDADALYEMCKAEDATLRLLEERDLCHRCPVEEPPSLFSSSPRPSPCLRPFSLVAVARVYLNLMNGEGLAEPEALVPSVGCEGIRALWTPAARDEFASILTDCVAHQLRMADDTAVTPDENYGGGGRSSRCTLPVPMATIVSCSELEPCAGGRT